MSEIKLPPHRPGHEAEHAAGSGRSGFTWQSSSRGRLFVPFELIVAQRYDTDATVRMHAALLRLDNAQEPDALPAGVELVS